MLDIQGREVFIYVQLCMNVCGCGYCKQGKMIYQEGGKEKG